MRDLGMRLQIVEHCGAQRSEGLIVGRQRNSEKGLPASHRRVCRVGSTKCHDQAIALNSDEALRIVTVGGQRIDLRVIKPAGCESRCAAAVEGGQLCLIEHLPALGRQIIAVFVGALRAIAVGNVIGRRQIGSAINRHRHEQAGQCVRRRLCKSQYHRNTSISAWRNSFASHGPPR